MIRYITLWLGRPRHVLCPTKAPTIHGRPEALGVETHLPLVGDIHAILGKNKLLMFATLPPSSLTLTSLLFTTSL